MVKHNYFCTSADRLINLDLIAEIVPVTTPPGHFPDAKCQLGIAGGTTLYLDGHDYDCLMQLINVVNH